MQLPNRLVDAGWRLLTVVSLPNPLWWNSVIDALCPPVAHRFPLLGGPRNKSTSFAQTRNTLNIRCLNDEPDPRGASSAYGR